jgi:hypothetical protein
MRVVAYLLYTPAKMLAVVARKWLGFQWRDYDGPDEGTLVVVIAIIGGWITMGSISMGTVGWLLGVAIGAFMWVPPVVAALVSALGGVAKLGYEFVSWLVRDFIEMYRKKLNERK